MTATRFGAEAQAHLHEILAARRDCRHFLPGPPLPDDQLQRLLEAANQAPSVGLMQPWRFMRLLGRGWRDRLAPLVEAERQTTAQALGPRADEFLRLKVEGLRDCAELLALIHAADDGTVFGRRTLPREMALCSVGAAMQNLWLAARAENLGLGWVSMFDPEALARLLQLPAGARPLGLLCLGPVPAFYDRPMLEQQGWRERRPLQDLLMECPEHGD
jgi:5,6-dimethylbenzimidazole synthase